jgi:hypothetical protein
MTRGRAEYEGTDAGAIARVLHYLAAETSISRQRRVFFRPAASISFTVLADPLACFRIDEMHESARKAGDAHKGRRPSRIHRPEPGLARKPVWGLR